MATQELTALHHPLTNRSAARVRRCTGSACCSNLTLTLMPRPDPKPRPKPNTNPNPHQVCVLLKDNIDTDAMHTTAGNK